MRNFRLFILALLFSTTANSTVFEVIGSDQKVPYFRDAGFPDVTLPGSNFTMFSPTGELTVPGSQTVPDPVPNDAWPSTEDVTGTFDDSLICTTSDCTDVAMTLASNTAFTGPFWEANGVRVFAPGTYEIEACPPPVVLGVAADGSSRCGDNTKITFTVKPGQLGGHLLFTWLSATPIVNIDVVIVWDINGSFTRPNPNEGDTRPVFPGNPATREQQFPEETRIYTLAAVDFAYAVGENADILFPKNGRQGIQMVDGPFVDFTAVFNLFLDGSLVPPAPAITATPITGNVVTPGGGSVTLNAGSGFEAGTTFDWSASDAALVPLLDSTTNQAVTFDPVSFSSFENIIARVTATSGSLTGSDSFIMRMGCIASTQVGIDSDGDGADDDAELCTDGDNDGVLDYLDANNNDASTISTALNAEEAATETGTFTLGSLAASVTDANDNLGSGIVATIEDIGADDPTVIASCVGGCFDFTVTGITNLAVEKVVLPLSAAIPANPGYKKFTNGSWQAYVEDDNNSVDSAAKVGGTCPAPGDAAYDGTGLVTGNECVQLTIEDNGPNDADATAGTIADPSGVTESADFVPVEVKTKIEGGALGFYSLLVMFIGLSLRRKMS